MTECLVYTSVRSRCYIEKSRQLESRHTLLPVQYRQAYSEDRSTVPIAEKRALHAIRTELLNYSVSEYDYDFLKAALSPIVPDLKVYWDESKLSDHKRRAKELKGRDLELLRFASSIYNEFIDVKKLPILCRNHTIDFPQQQESYLCEQRYIYSTNYDQIHIFILFDELALNTDLQQLLLRFPGAALHLITLARLDDDSYARILSNYFGYNLNCKVHMEVVIE